MEELNRQLFAMINAPANPPAALLALARFSANSLIYVVALALLIAWLRGGGKVRLRLIDASVTAILAVVLNLVIAAIWYHPRPFEIGLGHQFTPHVIDASFPSDHGTVLFAIAFGLMAAGAGRIWSALALLAALMTAWARIYVGIHWPLDMAGSVLVAAGAVVILRPLLGARSGQAAKSAVLSLFDWLLKVAHIPASVIPRSSSSENAPQKGRA